MPAGHTHTDADPTCPPHNSLVALRHPLPLHASDLPHLLLLLPQLLPSRVPPSCAIPEGRCGPPTLRHRRPLCLHHVLCCVLRHLLCSYQPTHGPAYLLNEGCPARCKAAGQLQLLWLRHVPRRGLHVGLASRSSVLQEG